MKYVRIAGAVFVFLCCSLLVVTWTVPPPDTTHITWSTKVKARNGEILRLFTTDAGYWRIPAELENIDPTFITQLVAYEDKRFWIHPGVDAFAVARAIVQCITRGRVVSGASTLTMQSIRLLEPRPRTVTSKLIEMVQAFRLEQRLSKKEIVELYLSLAPYGGNIQGIEAACLLYYNTTPLHLTPSQAALLISLPQSPERRRPDLYPQQARQARYGVLQRLQSEGLMSDKQVELATIQPVPEHKYSTPFHAPQLAQKLRSANVLQWSIHSTLDYNIQTKAERIASRAQRMYSPDKTVAIMVVDNTNHEVLAHIGSGDFYVSQMDLTRATRSPGSTLKPFIYGLAFELGVLHPETKILDMPQRFDSYGPTNFAGGFHGWISVRKALQLSLNIPAVSVLNHIGPQYLLSRLISLDMPLSYQGDPGLSLALGGVGFSLHGLVELYCALANSGRFSPVKFQPGDANSSGKKLLGPIANWYVDDILRTLPGSALHPESGLNQIRYKTGTSYGYRDAWAIGYNQRYTVGVWTGRIDGGYGKGTTGLRSAVPVMLQLFASLPEIAQHDKKKVPLKGILSGSHQDLPANLQWFGSNGNILHHQHNPTISYPVNGSVVSFIGVSREDQHIPLKARGGTPPFHWLINGEVMQKPQNGADIFFNPQDPGGVHITLIDSKGKSDRVTIWVEEKMMP